MYYYYLFQYLPIYFRFGPRHIRTESPMVRKRNHATGAQPFDTLKVADIGDVDVCLYDIR